MRTVIEMLTVGASNEVRQTSSACERAPCDYSELETIEENMLTYADCRRFVSCVIREGVVITQYERWRLVKHVTCDVWPIAVYDLLSHCYAVDHISTYVGCMEVHVIALEASKLDDTCPFRELIKALVIRLVLQCLRDFDASQDSPLLRCVRTLISEWSLIWSLYFRINGGINAMLSWSLTLYDDVLLTEILCSATLWFPNYIVFSSDLFDLLLLSVMSHINTEFLTTLFEHEPVAALTTLVAHLSDEGVQAVCDDLVVTFPQLVSTWPTLFGIRNGPPVCTHACPITLEECSDPVLASDGHTYERDAIMNVLARSRRSPMTREWLDLRVRSNVDLLTWHAAKSHGLVQ